MLVAGGGKYLLFGSSFLFQDPIVVVQHISKLSGFDVGALLARVWWQCSWFRSKRVGWAQRFCLFLWFQYVSAVKLLGWQVFVSINPYKSIVYIWKEHHDSFTRINKYGQNHIHQPRTPRNWPQKKKLKMRCQQLARTHFSLRSGSIVELDFNILKGHVRGIQIQKYAQTMHHSCNFCWGQVV